MEPLVKDRWRGEFTVTDLGRYRYTFKAWVDRFKSWRRTSSALIPPRPSGERLSPSRERSWRNSESRIGSCRQS